MRRTVTPELLDEDRGSPAEIAASLRDLARINRWFGGVSTLAALAGRVAPKINQRRLTMLDVGAGAGDSARMLRATLAARGIKIEATLLDRSPAHFTSRDSVPALVADALALPFRGQSFDLVACSTFAHHLEPEELVAFVNRALTIARHAVLINDLRRSATHLTLVYLGFPLFRSHLTRHDGPASVRRAYTTRELGAILVRTRAARIEISRHYLCRMGAIAWVR